MEVARKETVIVDAVFTLSVKEVCSLRNCMVFVAANHPVVDTQEFAQRILNALDHNYYL